MATPVNADAFVMFGATGDLAKRKLFPALYAMHARGEFQVPVVGVARSDWHDDDFRTHVREAILAAVPDADATTLDSLCANLHLTGGDYSALATFDALAATLGRLGSEHPVHYLAIPPSLFPTVIESLSVAGLTNNARVVVEKPFGRNEQSAIELNRVLHEHLREEQVFRIDHYLGKESVEDLVVFRFANTFLEPIWNRNYVSSVQITMAESIGVDGRGAFYDSVGAIRDVVQNHLLQVVALLAMEPPVGPDAKHMSDEKMKVFSAMRSLDADHLVRGQYRGYRDEAGVAADSNVETFAAVRLEIDSWRWAGVPFYVRAGKAMATGATEAVVELRDPPAQLFDEAGPPGPQSNLIRFRLGKDDGVTFMVNAKTPGPSLDSEPVELGVDFASALSPRHEAYERLISDAIAGNPRRFGRFDIVEETWRIVEPILDDTRPVATYEKGSWGPAEADALLGGASWHSPKVNQ